MKYLLLTLLSIYSINIYRAEIVLEFSVNEQGSRETRPLPCLVLIFRYLNNIKIKYLFASLVKHL